MKTALFVDFDNAFLGLQSVSYEVAGRFGHCPAQWLNWLTTEFPSGCPEEGDVSSPRRVLVRRCYLNPASFGRFRRPFLEAGFDVIDCPPMTAAGKTSTDVHMVLDMVDAMQHPTGFDEFIVFSADADFSPILRRLRTNNRKTVVFAAGNMSQAYRASADVLIDVETFINDALGQPRFSLEESRSAELGFFPAPAQRELPLKARNQNKSRSEGELPLPMQAADSPPLADLSRQLLDISSDPIFCFGPDCRYEYANQAFADAVDKTLDEIVGRTVWEVFPKVEADKRATIIKWVLDHKEARTHEIVVRGRNGDRHYLTTATPIFGEHGQVVSVLANSKDITERKRFEEGILRSQTMLERTESFTHTGSWEWDAVTDTVTWSDELFRIFLRDPADGAPSFAEHGQLFYAEDMLRLKEAVETALTHGTSYELELRVIRQDGQTRVCLTRGYAQAGADRRFTRLFGSLQDITDQVQANGTLRQRESLLS